jgi:hypothetical protein
MVWLENHADMAAAPGLLRNNKLDDDAIVADGLETLTCPRHHKHQCSLPTLVKGTVPTR